MIARLAPEFGRYLSTAGPWMSWNLFLALLPWVLALFVFDRRVRPTPFWWFGAGACLVLLPNAAYVLTDVIHLPADVRGVPSDLVVLLAVLPMFAALFIVGFLAYVDTVRRLVEWTRSAGWIRRCTPLEITLHAVCAIAIYVGRIGRFNSWDIVVRPRAVSSATLTGLTRPLPLVGIALTFAILSLGYLATTTRMRALAQLRTR